MSPPLTHTELALLTMGICMLCTGHWILGISFLGLFVLMFIAVSDSSVTKFTE